MSLIVLLIIFLYLDKKQKWRTARPGTAEWEQKRHRYQNSKRPWVTVDKWYLLAFLGIFIRMGARRTRTLYEPWCTTHSLRDAAIANCMDRDSFRQVFRFIHFSDNEAVKTRKERENKLYKVAFVLASILRAFKECYTLGVYMAIDESMIRCKSMYVSFRQYNPMKPIKHGIKVFVLACATYAYVYNFRIYQGKGDCGTVMDIVLDKMMDGDMVGKNRVLFTDNWYTSIPLALHLFTRFQTLLVGTFTPTAGKPTGPNQFPFVKLKPADTKKLNRGWMRCAKKLFYFAKQKVEVQCILWLDSKVVGFVHTAWVGSRQAKDTVLRSVRDKFKGLVVSCHASIINYLHAYGAVDRADRGMADYTVGYRCARWYMRIFMWLIDAVCWNVWVIASFRMGDKDDVFFKYSQNKAPGKRYLFQLDLAESLMQYACEKAIEESGNRRNVRWMTQEIREASTPMTPDATPREHSLSPTGSKIDYCQLCYSNTDKTLHKNDRRRLCTYTEQECLACRKRLCRDCYTTTHATSS